MLRESVFLPPWRQRPQEPGSAAPWTREREQLGPGWQAPNCSRELAEDKAQGALQSDSWGSLAGAWASPAICASFLLTLVGVAGGSGNGAEASRNLDGVGKGWPESPGRAECLLLRGKVHNARSD